MTVNENGLYGTIGYDQILVDVTRVRTLGGQSGDIILGEGLTIDEDKVLSTTAKAEWGLINGNIEDQTDLVKYIEDATPNIEAGENIYLTSGTGNAVVINADDMRYDDSIGAFKSMEKLNNYLYSIEYNTIDYTSAKEHFNTVQSEGNGHCSLVRKGNLVGRNYDWTINNQVEFILKTKASGRLYSVTGVATAAAFTTSVMQQNKYIEDYKYLPFRLVDGINEKGLVCSVNELPANTDNSKNIDIEGNTPLIEKREEISMIMLVRYILDRFEHAVEAANYIQEFVNVKPIIDADGQPMNFHFCIADKNQTIYLYFYGNDCNYEIKQAGEDLVMTNFRLANTQLVDGYYSTTDSNIESFGQGIERANTLIDYTEGNLLDYLYNTVNFTKAYTTDERLTDFAGIDEVTIDNEEGLRAIQSDAALLYQQETEAGTLRTDADLWQSVHSIVYDFNDKTIKLKIQEIENTSEIFTFNPYPRIEIDFTPTEIEPTTTNFVSGTTYSIYNALQRIANLFAGYWDYIKDNITDLIPAQASTTNKLADKAFVNETVAQSAANFRGNWSTWNSVPIENYQYPEDYVGNRTPTNNDYLVVTDASDYASKGASVIFTRCGAYGGTVNYILSGLYSDSVSNIPQRQYGWTKTYNNDLTVAYVATPSGYPYSTYGYLKITFSTKFIDPGGIIHQPNEPFYIETTFPKLSNATLYKVNETVYDGSWRFLYTGDWDEVNKSGWMPAYRIGSAFTDAQQAAIDSGITSEKVDSYDGYNSRITAVETDKRDNIYEANKIYATDSEGKQIALDITAVQAHNYSDLTNKPTINGVEVSGDKTSDDYKIYTKQVAKTPENNTVVAKANEVTTLSLSANTTIELETSDLTDGANIYDIIITAGAAIKITWNVVGLKWNNDFPETLESGKKYEISILNNLALFSGWEA